MAIGESELNLIGEYVRGNLKEWLREVGPFGGQQDLVTTAQFQVGMDRLDERFVHTQERLIRVEEELKAGRDVMVARFEASDRRFESIDLRISDLIKTMDDRFNTLTRTMDERFHSAAKASDDRFTDLIKTMDDRFEAMDKRFSLLTWMIGAIMAIVVTVLGVLLV